MTLLCPSTSDKYALSREAVEDEEETIEVSLLEDGPGEGRSAAEVTVTDSSSVSSEKVSIESCSVDMASFLRA